MNLFESANLSLLCRDFEMLAGKARIAFKPDWLKCLNPEFQRR
jgi:hypothetical protein